MSDEILNDTQKEQWLLSRGWSKIQGYLLEYDKDEQYNNSLFVSVEEFEKIKQSEPKTYYANPNYFYVYRLKKAFENDFEDFSTDNYDDETDEQTIIRDIIKQLEGKQ
jgi:hypothetical protein